jgi:hypothetical protein
MLRRGCWFPRGAHNGTSLRDVVVVPRLHLLLDGVRGPQRVLAMLCSLLVVFAGTQRQQTVNELSGSGSGVSSLLSFELPRGKEERGKSGTDGKASGIQSTLSEVERGSRAIERKRRARDMSLSSPILALEWNSFKQEMKI